MTDIFQGNVKELATKSSYKNGLAFSDFEKIDGKRRRQGRSTTDDYSGEDTFSKSHDPFANEDSIVDTSTIYDSEHKKYGNFINEENKYRNRFVDFNSEGSESNENLSATNSCTEKNYNNDIDTLSSHNDGGFQTPKSILSPRTPKNGKNCAYNPSPDDNENNNRSRKVGFSENLNIPSNKSILPTYSSPDNESGKLCSSRGGISYGHSDMSYTSPLSKCSLTSGNMSPLTYLGSTSEELEYLDSDDSDHKVPRVKKSDRKRRTVSPVNYHSKQTKRDKSPNEIKSVKGKDRSDSISLDEITSTSTPDNFEVGSTDSDSTLPILETESPSKVLSPMRNNGSMTVKKSPQRGNYGNCEENTESYYDSGTLRSSEHKYLDSRSNKYMSNETDDTEESRFMFNGHLKPQYKTGDISPSKRSKASENSMQDENNNGQNMYECASDTDKESEHKFCSDQSDSLSSFSKRRNERKAGLEDIEISLDPYTVKRIGEMKILKKNLRDRENQQWEKNIEDADYNYEYESSPLRVYSEDPILLTPHDSKYLENFDIVQGNCVLSPRQQLDSCKGSPKHIYAESKYFIDGKKSPSSIPSHKSRIIPNNDEHITPCYVRNKLANKYLDKSDSDSEFDFEDNHRTHLRRRVRKVVKK